MADLTGVTTNFLPTAHETFQDTLSATILALDTIVYVTNLGEYTDGDVVVLTVEPGTANEATFTGVKASAPYRVTGCVWTEGNLAVGHSSGATIIDYDSATHYNMLSKALKEIMAQDGSLLTQPVRDALGLGASAANGWEALGYAPNTVVDDGGGQYTATFNSVDLTGTTGIGDKMLLPRAATNTQCADFDGVNDYFSKATPNKMAWTDDFCYSAWLKPTRQATTGTVISRRNGTQGFDCRLATGTHSIDMVGYNAALGNYSLVYALNGIPASRWTHVAGLLDMSAFTALPGTAETAKSWIMYDGVEQPCLVSRAGTNPTALVQAGNWEIGSVNTGTTLYKGKMAQAAVYNTRVLQSVIRASRNQPLVGNETGLATAHSFNNSLLDLNTTTPNDLTANGGVLATSVDTPFTQAVTGTNLTAGTRNYATITNQAFSTNTVYTLKVISGDTIPITTPPTSVSYSKQKSPYGVPIAGQVTPTEINNPYRFLAYLPTNQTGIADATATKVAWAGKHFDPNNNMDVITNRRYTVPVSGVYQINATLSILSPGNTMVASVGYLYKNGATLQVFHNTYPNVGIGNQVAATGSLSTLLELLAGDYLEIYVYGDVTTSNITVTGGNESWFSGYLVSAF